jgi:hypothetical protein
MNAIQTIDEHIIIRDTVGYDGIKDIEIHDLPSVIEFLKIVHNYQRMNHLINKDEHICTGPRSKKMR